MNIPYELVSMAMVLKDYVEDLPYKNDEHERLVDFVDYLRHSDGDEQEVQDLFDAGYDPTDLITNYDEDYFIHAVAAALAIEEYVNNDGSIQELLVDYLTSVGHKPYNPNEGIDEILLANTKITASEEFDVGEENTFTFNSPEEIYAVLDSRTQDLYCIDDDIYLFNYNEAGAIAYYVLYEYELYDIAEEAYECGVGYIGGMLGPGGSIIDVQLKAPDGRLIDYDDPEFNEYWNDTPGYELDYTEIYNFLQGFVGKKFINANVNDLVNIEE